MNIKRSTSNYRKLKFDSLLLMTTATLLFALATNFGMGLKLGMDEKMVSDAHFYLQIAKNFAEGKGYSSPSTHWPNSPTMSNLPGWPILVSIALSFFDDSQPDTVMRILCLSMNSMASVLIFWLTFVLFRRSAAAFISGLAYSLHPTGLKLAYSGLSEILFILLVTIGLLILLINARSHLPKFIGFLILGCSSVVRANFVLFIPFVLLFFGISSGRRVIFSSKRLLANLICVAILLLPMSIWTIRNYSVSGQFPVLSTLSGATFYGANNPIVANNLEYWGNWIWPDFIPGEVTMKEMARTMTEIEVQRHYSQKGMEYVLNNLFIMPRLLLGKFIRAYVPVPFKPDWQSYVASLFRWFLYAGSILGLAVSWKETAIKYRILFLSMLFVNISTVLIFLGNARFAFEIEPFAIPFFSMGVTHLISKIRCGNKSRPAITIS